VDAERDESSDRFFHRQADDICIGAVDFCDDLRAATLGGISAGLVQRVHSRKIVIDLRGA